MPDEKTSSNPRPRPADLLPNEQEISYEHVHNYFNRNMRWIVALCVALILVAGWMMLSRYQEDKLRQEANTKLAQAHSTEALQAIAGEYAGTDAAMIASLAMGDAWFQQRQWDKAGACYQEIALRYPSSPMAPSAMIGLAAIAESTGKTAEAIKTYQAVASSFPNGFQAAQAQFAAARLLEEGGKLQEARKAYEDLITTHPSSAWKGEAEERLDHVAHLLKNKPAASKT